MTYNLFREQETLRAGTPASAAKLDPPFDSWKGVVERKARAPAVPPDRRQLAKLQLGVEESDLLSLYNTTAPASDGA